MSLVIPNTFSSGATLDPTEVNQNFTAVANKMGSIVNEDIASNAAISVDKLSAQYERVVINARIPNAHLSAADTYFYIPFLSPASPGWVVDGITFTIYNNSTGALLSMSGTKDASVQWGEITKTTGVWTTVTTVTSGQQLDGLYATSATLSNATLGAIGGASTEIPAFRFYLDTYSGSAANAEAYMSIVLKRKIQAS